LRRKLDEGFEVLSKSQGMARTLHLKAFYAEINGVEIIYEKQDSYGT
jgi:hypothetical protein